MLKILYDFPQTFLKERSYALDFLESLRIQVTLTVSSLPARKMQMSPLPD